MGSLGGMRLWLEAQQRGERFEKVLSDQAIWPVSFLACAYFAAALVGWVVVGLSQRRVPIGARGIIWFGALTSVAYLIVIVASKKYCQYCLSAHAANLILLLTTEIGMRTVAKAQSSVSVTKGPASGVRSAQSVSPQSTVGGGGARGGVGGRRLPAFAAPLAGVLAFSLVSAGLAVGEESRRAELAKTRESAFDDSTKKLLEKVNEDKAKLAAGQGTVAETLPWGPGGFTGRWQIGPKEAQVRIVMISSYQCPDCKRNEGEIFTMLDDPKFKGKISLSAMHFPLCPDCNKFVIGSNPHPNSCWAARAAETAGILKGSDGFWKMHKWLFDRLGSFTDAELNAALPGLGFEVAAFNAIMQTEATLRPVQQDIEIGSALGLYFTPMIFINGVEFRGWQGQQGITRAVEAALAVNPPVQGPLSDKPVLAREKFVGDWREMPARDIPGARPERTLGKSDATVRVEVFGDLTEANTRKVDDLVRVWATSGSKPVSYRFRHYPGDKSCNVSLPKTFFPFGCAASKAAEAAGKLGGPDAYWKMHAWILANRERITSLNAIKEGGASLGIDPAKLEAAMNEGDVSAAITNDINVARQIGVGQIPAVYVNGKFVQRWAREGDNVLERIVDEAGKKK